MGYDEDLRARAAAKEAEEAKFRLWRKRLFIALGCAVLLAVFWPFRVVPTGYRGVVTVYGKIQSVEGEGLKVLVPFVQRLDVFSVRAEEATIDNAEGSTKDTQPVRVSLTVRYSIEPDKVAEVFEKYSHSGDLSSYVNTATLEAFKAVTARYTAPDLISQRQAVSQDVVAALRTGLQLYGAQVIKVDMRNFEFSKDYMAAINEKVTQEQKRLAAENKLKTVEAEQKQKVAIAEAEAGAERAKADGVAYAQLKVATAQAEALRVQNAALQQNKEVLELRRIEVQKIEAERWDGHRVANQYFGSAPIPVTSVVGK